MSDPEVTAAIVRQAFLLMEQAPPSSLADDSPQGNDAAAVFEDALGICLEAGDWSFASVRRALPEVELPTEIAPDPDLIHAYALPGDCLVLREVSNGLHGPRIRWRRDMGFLHADCRAPLPVRYTARPAELLVLPATFRHAVAHQMALMLGARWLTTNTKMDRIGRNFEAAMARALRTDARQADAAPWNTPVGDWAREAIR